MRLSCTFKVIAYSEIHRSGGYDCLPPAKAREENLKQVQLWNDGQITWPPRPFGRLASRSAVWSGHSPLAAAGGSRLGRSQALASVVSPWPGGIELQVALPMSAGFGKRAELFANKS
jgi:hypothetical protein